MIVKHKVIDIGGALREKMLDIESQWSQEQKRLILRLRFYRSASQLLCLAVSNTDENLSSPCRFLNITSLNAVKKSLLKNVYNIGLRTEVEYRTSAKTCETVSSWGPLLTSEGYTVYTKARLNQGSQQTRYNNAIMTNITTHLCSFLRCCSLQFCSNCLCSRAFLMTWYII